MPGNALTGVGVNITAPPGPVGTATNGIQGFDLPGSTTGAPASSTSGASSGSGAASTSGSGSAAPSPTGGSNGAMANAVSGAALVASLFFGTMLL